MEKLDRVLVTVDWEEKFPFCFLQPLSSDISDHCPLLLSTNAATNAKRRFHFEVWWLKLPGFLDVVSTSWTCPSSITDPFNRLDVMFKSTARALQSCSQRSIGQIKQQILVARTIVLWLDTAQEQRQLLAEELELRRTLKCKLLGLSSLERTMARLRSRMIFLKDGDANTRLFHLQASHRMKKKVISKLQYEGGIAVTQQEKEHVLYSYFKNIMGTPSARTEATDLSALDFQRANLEHLDAVFLEDEVRSTIKSLPGEKSPGPDGFTAEFYKAAWPVIRNDIMADFRAFYRGCCAHFHRLNGALITLLPKKPDAAMPSEYRPISLIHSFAKLVAKLLANRLAPQLDHLIAVNQSAFIKKRSIHDNFKFVEQAAKTLHRKKKSSLLLKLDISKAFDTVAWPFLLQLLGDGVRPKVVKLDISYGIHRIDKGPA